MPENHIDKILKALPFFPFHDKMVLISFDISGDGNETFLTITYSKIHRIYTHLNRLALFLGQLSALFFGFSFTDLGSLAEKLQSLVGALIFRDKLTLLHLG